MLCGWQHGQILWKVSGQYLLIRTRYFGILSLDCYELPLEWPIQLYYNAFNETIVLCEKTLTNRGGAPFIKTKNHVHSQCTLKTPFIQVTCCKIKQYMYIFNDRNTSDNMCT